MDLQTWITGEYRAMRQIFRMGVGGLVPTEKMAVKPGAGSNSIAWLIWHLARCEDVAINTVVRDAPQVFLEGDWAGRLGITRTEIGTGFSDDEVASFGSSVNVPELIAYWDAVEQQTIAWLDNVTPDQLDIVPDVPARLKSAPEFVSQAGSWVVPLWSNKPVSFFVGWVVIGHGYGHVGEMQGVRGQLGIRGM